MASASPMPLLLFFLVVRLFFAAAHAKVPANETFTYVNQGEFGPYIIEYDASYRVLPTFGSPFQLCFYNTTPGAFYLAIRMGLSRSESLFRWVWEANRGRPVGENAIISFQSDGNLVLTEADGRVVWSTETADKGVVSLDLFSTGNLVLRDASRKFVWQSIDQPTETLLVGQSLHLSGPTKLVSRTSAMDGSLGAYSFVMEPKGLTLFINNISAEPVPYSEGVWGFFGSNQTTSVKLEAELEYNQTFAYALNLALSDKAGGSQGSFGPLARPKYNATLSFLRLNINGNLVAYTYYDPVDYGAWEMTFAFFSNRLGLRPTCELPSKCGAIGVCKDEMCVACPTPKGLLGWDEGCRLLATPACGGQKVAVDYYKMVGVENLISNNVKGDEGVKAEECKRRCSSDCKCVGFLYWEMESKCWLAPRMGTLAKVSNSSHVACIKY